MSVEPIRPHDDIALGNAMRHLPLPPPPADAWLRVQRTLSAAPSPRHRDPRQRRWRAVLAFAAVLALAFGLRIWWPAAPGEVSTVNDVPVAESSQAQLLRESAELERWLLALGPGQRDAESLALELPLIDRLQWVDHLLGDPDASALTREVLWRERVGLQQQRVALRRRESLLAASDAALPLGSL